MSGIALILQARMGSTRYPGKALVDIAGRTLLERVMYRLERLFDGPKVLAIPDTERDDALVPVAAARGWGLFRGSEVDVLGRYAGAAAGTGAGAVIRATADNPLVHPLAVAGVAEELARGAACVGTRGFPPGASVEGASSEALLAAAAEATDAYDREHVMPFLYKHAERFAPRFVAAPPFAVTPRVTVDTPEDVARVRRVFAVLGDDPSFEDVTDLLVREGMVG